MKQCLIHRPNLTLCATALLILAPAWGQSAKQTASQTGTQPSGNPLSPTNAMSQGPIEILSDTKGVDFGPYLHGVLANVQRSWYAVMPQVAMAPELKQGKVIVEFSILKDGHVEHIRCASASGDVSLDRAAYGGISASNPFPPLPSQFTGDYLRLRFRFLYNPSRDEIQKENESVRLSEILIPIATPTPASDDEPEVQAARSKAEDLRAQIRAGKSFEEVAGNDPDVGWFRRGALSKSIEDVVFSMKVDEVSDVIRTKQGFVILKVTKHRGQKSAGEVGAGSPPSNHQQEKISK